MTTQAASQLPHIIHGLIFSRDSVNFESNASFSGAILTAMPDAGDGRDPNELHCGRDALTGPLGLLVQAMLAFIAFGALIGKLPPHPP